MCERRSVRLCCHESPHGEAIGSLMRLFHTVSLGSSVNREATHPLRLYVQALWLRSNKLRNLLPIVAVRTRALYSSGFPSHVLSVTQHTRADEFVPAGKED